MQDLQLDVYMVVGEVSQDQSQKADGLACQGGPRERPLRFGTLRAVSAIVASSRDGIRRRRQKPPIAGGSPGCAVQED